MNYSGITFHEYYNSIIVHQELGLNCCELLLNRLYGDIVIFTVIILMKPIHQIQLIQFNSFIQLNVFNCLNSLTEMKLKFDWMDGFILSTIRFDY